jgi:hypothetical protein
VLLTRSPLSPGPKPWFSLDLHVLSAPPAFVLSQDQTLREETFLPLPEGGGKSDPFELESSIRLPKEKKTGSFPLAGHRQAEPDERSRRFTLLSFQRPRRSAATKNL